MQVRSLGREDLLEKEMANQSSILADSPWGRKGSDMTEQQAWHDIICIHTWSSCGPGPVLDMSTFHLIFITTVSFNINRKGKFRKMNLYKFAQL